ncbi:hypothetical protein M407DRAFT_25384 [Tulasnella calospora MUT 4182]|uniref:F-box domain-containing protein n=1 Tax=Tulasnella calospora MUT 4182 TaxID=1051891 RepID=A0A0C3QG75_9AGAM|nr:hypothetical protein M407DRAFT_25384 [Tulasnella calospora MUT 4182]
MLTFSLQYPISLNWTKDDGVLETEFMKDDMITVLEHIPLLFILEAARLKRRRNREHSFICRLPLELLVSILLLCFDSSRWNMEELRTLASVSTYWRDAILSCSRFWSVMNVTTSAEARAVIMKRNQGGPVDVWCCKTSSKSALEKFINDIKTIKPTRLRTVRYEVTTESRRFMDYLRSNTSAIIDLYISNSIKDPSAAYLELSSEGPNFQYLDLRGTSLQWQSPRLSNLRLLYLKGLHQNVPQVHHLYNILSSSPQLEFLCLINLVALDGQALGSLPASPQRIDLPVLETIVLQSLPDAVKTNIIPLIRASACHTVDVGGRHPVTWLELQESTLALIANPITLSTQLEISLSISDRAYIYIRSHPFVGQDWVHYDVHSTPGVNVKLATPAFNVLPHLWNHLGDALGGHGKATRIKSLDVKWAGQEFPFPFALLEHCPALTHLRFDDHRGTTLHILLSFLRGHRINGSHSSSRSSFPLPNLSSLSFYARFIPNLENCICATKDLLERRYPALQGSAGTSDIRTLNDLRLPSLLVKALRRQHGVATSLDLEKVLHI